jgi:hypothetical protein
MRIGVVFALLIGGWLALLPPFFTHGECTAEFDAVSRTFDGARAALATVQGAREWLVSQAMPFRELSAEACAASRMAEIEVCTGGPLLLVAVPVKNQVCHYYRDSSIRLQLGFNKTQQLVRMQTDMNPYHMLKLPMFAFELDWAK